MLMFTYRFWHPGAHNDVTLDCPADTRDAALKSAQRFITKLNRSFKRAGIVKRAQMPSHQNQLRPELPRLPIIAEGI